MSQASLSAYQFTWSVVAYDFPLDTKAARRSATAVLRNLDRRFCVGGRWGTARHGAMLVLGGHDKVMETVGECPPDGEIRIYGMTDKQMQLSRNHWGRRRTMADAVQG